jgi:hypothetical protein
MAYQMPTKTRDEKVLDWVCHAFRSFNGGYRLVFTEMYSITSEINNLSRDYDVQSVPPFQYHGPASMWDERVQKPVLFFWRPPPKCFFRESVGISCGG